MNTSLLSSPALFMTTALVEHAEIICDISNCICSIFACTHLGFHIKMAVTSTTNILYCRRISKIFMWTAIALKAIVLLLSMLLSSVSFSVNISDIYVIVCFLFYSEIMWKRITNSERYANETRGIDHALNRNREQNSNGTNYLLSMLQRFTQTEDQQLERQENLLPPPQYDAQCQTARTKAIPCFIPPPYALHYKDTVVDQNDPDLGLFAENAPPYSLALPTGELAIECGPSIEYKQ